MSEQRQRDDELGALWRKDGRGKADFYTGSVVCPYCNCKSDVVVFENGYKTADNHPSFRILKSQPKGEGRPSTRRDEQPYQKPTPNAADWQPQRGNAMEPPPAGYQRPPAAQGPPRGQQASPARQAPQRPPSEEWDSNQRRQQQPDWDAPPPHPINDDDIPF